MVHKGLNFGKRNILKRIKKEKAARWPIRRLSFREISSTIRNIHKKAFENAS